MDSLCRTLHRPLQLHPFPRRLVSSKTLSITLVKPSSSSRKPPPLYLRAAAASSSSAKATVSPLPALLKSASVAATAAAALFLFHLRSPALAIASVPPPATEEVQPQTLPASQNITDAEQGRVPSQPESIDSLRSLLEQKVKAGMLDEAVAVIDRMIALEPEDTDLRLLKAHLESYSGESDSAKQGFERLLEKDPFLVEAYHGLVMEASQSDDDGSLDDILRRVENAMELCKKANKKEQLRDFRLLLAQIRVMEGDYTASLEIYQDLVKEEPRDFRPYLYQGIVYSLMRKKDEAEKQFQKYRTLVPKDHPYAQYLDDNMAAMKAFAPKEENKSKAQLKS